MSGSFWVDSARAWVIGQASWQPGATMVPVGAPAVSLVRQASMALAHCLPRTDTVDVPLESRPCLGLAVTEPAASTLAAGLALGQGTVRLAATTADTGAICAVLAETGQALPCVLGQTGTVFATVTPEAAYGVMAGIAPTSAAGVFVSVATIAEGSRESGSWRFVSPRPARAASLTPVTRALRLHSGLTRCFSWPCRLPAR